MGLNVLMLTTGFLLYHLAERRWKSRVYSWREIRRVLVRQQGRNRVRLKLIIDRRTYVLKSKVYSEGWEDFADTLLRSVKTYNIPIRWDE